jgi:VWFA-related protein
LQLTQNFTADGQRLKNRIAGKASAQFQPALSQRPEEPQQLEVPWLLNGLADFSARNMLFALRDVAKSLALVPGRKTMVLLTSGFPLNVELRSELTAAIDACNRTNIAVYPIDVSGLKAGLISSLQRPTQPLVPAIFSSSRNSAPHVLLVQHGGGGGGGGGGGHGGSTGGGSGGSGQGLSPAYDYNPNSPAYQPSDLLPHIPTIPSSVGEDVLYELALGTGGFVIHNTNDLLAGLDHIAKEQGEYYILGYTPPYSVEGSCPTIKVKVDRGGAVVRSRTGYCNVKPIDLLAGKEIEHQLEAHAAKDRATEGSLEAPFFFISPNVARVNVAMEVPSHSI